MRFFPADPWLLGLHGEVETDEIDCEWRGEHNLDTGESHQAEITAGGKRFIGRQELCELSSTFEKAVNDQS